MILMKKVIKILVLVFIAAISMLHFFNNNDVYAASTKALTAPTVDGNYIYTNGYSLVVEEGSNYEYTKIKYEYEKGKYKYLDLDPNSSEIESTNTRGVEIYINGFDSNLNPTIEVNGGAIAWLEIQPYDVESIGHATTTINVNGGWVNYLKPSVDSNNTYLADTIVNVNGGTISHVSDSYGVSGNLIANLYDGTIEFYSTSSYGRKYYFFIYGSTFSINSISSSYYYLNMYNLGGTIEYGPYVSFLN